MARGRTGSSISRIPLAIAPEVTMTTRSPPCSSAATCPQTESRTSVRSSPSSAATIEEPSFTTSVMQGSLGAHPAPAGRSCHLDMKLELVLADAHVVARLEAGVAQGRNHPDLQEPLLQVGQ